MEIKCDKFVPAGRLTTKDLAPFLDGQVEVTKFRKGCVYVAHIGRLVVEGNQLRMGFPLVLNGDGYPPFPRHWVRDDSRNSCVLDLGKYLVADIGPSMEGGGNRWFLQSADRSDSVILYPADGRKFDQRAVGLLATPVSKFPTPTGIKFFVD